jgi:hypothetical protein
MSGACVCVLPKDVPPDEWASEAAVQARYFSGFAGLMRHAGGRDGVAFLTHVLVVAAVDCCKRSAPPSPAICELTGRQAGRPYGMCWMHCVSLG